MNCAEFSDLQDIQLKKYSIKTITSKYVLPSISNSIIRNGHRNARTEDKKKEQKQHPLSNCVW